MRDRFTEEFFNLFDLIADLDLFLEELQTVDEYLFEDHDHKQISCQSREALAVKGRNEVTDVGVDELEHVDLVDDRVFEVRVVPMVFTEHDLHCSLVIYLSEDDD